MAKCTCGAKKRICVDCLIDEVDRLQEALQEQLDYSIPEYCNHATGYFKLKDIAEKALLATEEDV